VSEDRYFVGLISGTSVDGVDAVVVAISGQQIDVVASHVEPYPEGLRRDILALAQPGINEIDRLGAVDRQVADVFAQAALTVVSYARLGTESITAIGSHGQTVRHRPKGEHPFTLQIGDPNRIAELTGINTIADFRRRDVAAGGQGAPLAPAFHRAAFGLYGDATAVVNIGGIANITLFDDEGGVRGFDSGPGNTLMDAWIREHRDEDYDRDGQWAAQGEVDPQLLENLLDDAYFTAPPPKSTGPEYFDRRWLQTRLGDRDDAEYPADVQRTLLELTAKTITDALGGQPLAQLAVCGGGAHNTLLMNRLDALLDTVQVTTTEALGVHPDWVEATAFAWLAARTLDGLPGNEPTVTGAAGLRVLGSFHPA
jgi:anhydro-N-acetylmuramic acid kinase